MSRCFKTESVPLPAASWRALVFPACVSANPGVLTIVCELWMDIAELAEVLRDTPEREGVLLRPVATEVRNW